MKGMFHTIEAVIVLAMLMVSVAVVFKPIQRADDSTLLAKSGYSVLHHLDDSGRLRQAAASNDMASIRAELRQWLSDFDVEICTLICTGTTRQDVTAVDYFIAGYQSFDPIRIRLYMW